MKPERPAPRPSGWARSLRHAVALGAVLALLGIAIASSPLGAYLEEQWGLRALYAARGERPAPPAVAIVGIDRAAARALGLPNKPERWPRSLHAQMVTKLQDAGAEVVAFDLLFKEPGDAAADRAFAHALRGYDRAVLLEMLEGGGERQGALTLWTEERILPHALFAEAGRTTAPFPLPKTPVLLHQYWTFKSSAGDLPTLPVAALAVAAAPAYDRVRTLMPQPSSLPPSLNLRGGELLEALRSLHFALMERPQAAIELSRAAARMNLSAPDRATLEALLLACTDGPSRHLYLYGPPRTLTTLRYDRVLAMSTAELAPLVRGRAVFVGYSETVLQEQRDSYYTVYSQEDGSDIAGVEIAATAYANLIEARPLRPLSAPAHVLLLAGFAFALAFALMPWPALVGAALALTVAGAYAAAAAHAFTAHAAWWPLAVPLGVELPLAAGLALAWRYRESARARRRLKEAVSFYLPGHVVETLGNDSAKIAAGGDIMHGVCLATDAAQYTTLAESVSADALSRLMNAYYEVLFAPVRRHGGIISDVVGDSMLALWAQREENAALRTQACLAAVEIDRDVRRFNSDAAHPALPTRVGLHHGELVLGNVGALDHYEYRAVGDMVNTASRIQGLNKYLGTRVLASAQVLAGVEAVCARPIGQFLLSGKTLPLDICEILGLRDEMDAARRARLERFAEALASYTSGAWRQAEYAFASLLDEDPRDGVAAFYLDLCRRAHEAPPREWTGVVNIAEK